MTRSWLRTLLPFFLALGGFATERALVGGPPPGLVAVAALAAP